MTLRSAPLLLAAAALVGSRAQAQTATAYLDAGVRAYQDLDFDRAASMLRRATDPASDLPDLARKQALSYLGAAEILRGRSDSARAVFGRVVRLDPRYQIDRLVFPPEVTSVFDGVRRTTRAVAVTLPDSVAFRAGQPGLVMDLFPSSFHEVRVAVQRSDGSVARIVFEGPAGDSLRVEWDGRTTAGDPPAAGRYVLVFSSLDSLGTPGRILRVPFIVDLELGDTLLHPGPPPDSALLPERTEAGPALQAVLGGITFGAALALLPAAIASDIDLSPARFAIGASMGIAGIGGFFARKPGRPIPANIDANARRLEAWRLERDRIARENQALKARARLQLRFGPSQAIERDRP